MSENKPLPRKHLRKEETFFIVFMLLSVRQFREMQKEMPERLRSIPNGWRDIRMVETVLDKLIGNLLDTIPLEKLQTLQMLMQDTQVHITYTRQIGKGKDHVSGILTRDLDMLMAAAQDGVCKLCDGNCDRCDLGKVFDRFMNTRREKGESYTFVDVADGFDVKGIKKGK